MLFDIKDVDKKFYNERLRDFLPEKIIDIHTHVWLDRMVTHTTDELAKVVSWPSKIAKDNSIEDLLETYELLFPDKSVSPMTFSNVIDKNSMDKMNAYVAQCAETYNLPSLAFTQPDWDAEKFETIVTQGGFLGAKVYLTFSANCIPTNEIRIFDFLPHHQLDVLNRHNWIVMLHIPRDKRLRDPLNLAQMLEIENRYPNIKLIIAHVGRAYCPEDIGNAFEVLADTKNMMFDFSANTNTEVFEKLIKAVGPKRIMFGSDMPITRMRMRRICENGHYINVVPKGLYGNISADKNMREVVGKEAEHLSFFIYEEIDAFRRASERTKLSRVDIEDVFYNNAQEIINPNK
ncbi:MAG: amidohydrolase family protein [Planctomycetes bacterium]|nr:amidohydrolase family protein [Planctomycetota bacterium]